MYWCSWKIDPTQTNPNQHDMYPFCKSNMHTQFTATAWVIRSGRKTSAFINARFQHETTQTNNLFSPQVARTGQWNPRPWSFQQLHVIRQCPCTLDRTLHSTDIAFAIQKHEPSFRDQRDQKCTVASICCRFSIKIIQFLWQQTLMLLSKSMSKSSMIRETKNAFASLCSNCCCRFSIKIIRCLLLQWYLFQPLCIHSNWLFIVPKAFFFSCNSSRICGPCSFLISAESVNSSSLAVMLKFMLKNRLNLETKK